MDLKKGVVRMKKRIWFSLCLYLFFLSGCKKTSGVYFEEPSTVTKDQETVILDEDSETVLTTEERECYVYLCGAVKNPGVYHLPSGSRVYEAILLAGGLLETACEDGVNQAEEVTDGQMIKILTEEEAFRQESSIQEPQEQADGRININTAEAADLMTLPGIGESKARSILSYREEKGSFSSTEEIMNITGIKEGVYSKIKDYITVH